MYPWYLPAFLAVPGILLVLDALYGIVCIAAVLVAAVYGQRALSFTLRCIIPGRCRPAEESGN